MASMYQAIKDDSNFLAGDVHQAILNVGYNEWKKHNDWHYRDMIEWMSFEYGGAYALAILLGKYNQQVGNGGHDQYMANGYAEGKGGFFSKHDASMPLHHQMIRGFKMACFDHPHRQYVLSIMEDFVLEAHSNTNEEDNEADLDTLGELDDRYYAINEDWMDYLNKYYTNLITNEKDQNKT
jgi:hypothetical protein